MDEAHKKELKTIRLKLKVKFKVTFVGSPNYSKAHIFDGYFEVF